VVERFILYVSFVAWKTHSAGYTKNLPYRCNEEKLLKNSNQHHTLSQRSGSNKALALLPFSVCTSVQTVQYTVKKVFARFLSLVGMSLIKLSPDRNNLPIISQNFMLLVREFYQSVFVHFLYIFLGGIFPGYFLVILFPDCSFCSPRQDFSRIYEM
jgi:hypothetical protein